MISIIIILIVVISITATFSYTMLTFNHNLTLLNSSKMADNELKLIKSRLIAKALPLDQDNYSMLAGTQYSNYNGLPKNLGLPLKNSEGFNYIYCPYNKNTLNASGKVVAIQQEDGSSYKINIQTINDKEYVVGSDSAPSFPENSNLKAIIISKFKNTNLNCKDIQYNNDDNIYFLPNAKITTIDEADLNAYYETFNLSSKTEQLTMSQENASSILSILKNDKSNKSYNIKLNSDVIVSQDYEIDRDSNKRSDILIDLNNFKLNGTKKLSFKNVDLTIKNNNDKNVPTEDMPLLSLTNVEFNLINAKIGALNTDNSIINIDNSLIYNTLIPKAIFAKNTKITMTGKNVFYGNAMKSNENAIDLYSSDFILSDGQILFGFYNSTPKTFLTLTNSTFTNYGLIEQLDSSNYPNIVINVDANSHLNLIGGVIKFLGKATYGSNIYPIELSGQLLTNKFDKTRSLIMMKNMSSHHAGIIEGVNGARMDLSYVDIGNNYFTGKNTIGTDGNGFSRISGSKEVNIYGRLSCWSGNIFKNIDGTANNLNSQSNNYNNFSNWNCRLK